MGVLEQLIAGMLTQGQAQAPGQGQIPGQPQGQPHLTPDQLGGLLQAVVTMQLIDQLTPKGQIPPQNQMGDLAGQLLKSLLR